jgi:dienelactone hydrolase
VKAQGGDTSHLGIIGFCRGGRTVWEYAAYSTELKAGVAFYGAPVDPPNPAWPKSPMQLAPDMKAPVLGLYGAEDTGIPVAQVEAFKAALADNRRPPSSRSFPAHHTASTPIIAEATARKRRKMPGIRCRHGSRNTARWANRTNYARCAKAR